MEVKTLPVSTNSLYRGRRFLTKEGKANKYAIAMEIRSQWRQKPKEGPLRVSIDLRWPDRRRRDVDNIKGILDALTGILWKDDSQIVDLAIKKYVVDKGRSGFSISVQEA